MLRPLLSRIVAACSGRRLDRRIDEEIETHLALATDAGIRRGLTPEAARTGALRALGGITQTREAHRDARRLPFVETVCQDVRYAIRGFRRTPIFTGIALLTLMLAIGANTAIFSLLNALVFRDLPIREPQSLVQVGSIAPGSTYEGGLTYAMFREFEQRQQVFSSVIGWLSNGVFNIASDNAATRGTVSVVTGNFFSELGVRPFAGRLLTPADVNMATLRPNMVAVLGHGFWRRHFGGDVRVIGQRVTVEGTVFTIVGIAPPAFTGLGLTTEADVTVPLTAYTQFSLSPSASTLNRPSGSFWVRTTGRLKPGVTIAQAGAALAVMWPTLKAANLPAEFAGAQRQRFLATQLSVTSAAKGIEPGVRHKFEAPLFVVFGIAVLVVTLACVNLASLMLARTAVRRHEMGIRLALGAGRGRLAQQLLTEGLLLSSVGAGCGIGLAYWSTGAIVRSIFRDYLVPATLNVRPDARVIAFTSLVAVAVGVLFSLAPASQAAAGNPSGELRHGSRTSSRPHHTGQVLVAAQVALSVVLVMSAGLLVRTLQQIRAVPSGMRADDVTVAYPSPRPGGYEGVDNDSYYPTVIGRLNAVAGVRGAAVSVTKPGGGGIGGGERVENAATPPEAGAGIGAVFAGVSPGFFDTVQIPLRSGRDFRWSDHSRAARVAIVSQTLARRLFPSGNALGQRVRVGVAPWRQSLEVVGVAADARIYDLKDSNLSAVYVAALQQPDSVNWKCFVIRGAGVSAESVRAAVDPLGAERIGRTEALTYIMDRVLLQERLTAMLAGFFGGLALLLAAIGLYGLMSYAVAQRRRDIGIRLALGAAPRRVTAEVLRDGLRITLTGVGVGFAAALASVQLVKSLLFGVTPYDPLTASIAPIALVIVATLACLLPALRASRVDPIVALRAD
ncbi:MAG TPA: ABC transporter permease [Vicinamibacterales bacterium]|nr:ABC transporter permease [Vicinamibacterales bacterium]